MKARIALSFVLITLSFITVAQKNVVPVTNSKFTGIQLPTGTRQDNRMLSTSLAATVLNGEAKNFQVTIDVAEVLQLPAVKSSAWDNNRFRDAVRQAGWQIIPIENKPQYGWLKRGTDFILYYYAEFTNRTDLYFGTCIGTPALSEPPTQVTQLPEVVNQPVNNQNTVTQPVNNSTPPQQTQANPGGYTYFITNWDDGWTSTIEANKVVVTKGNVRVHLYFPLSYDDGSRSAGRDFYWDNYLTKEFRITAKQYRDHGEMMTSFQAPYIEGNAIDPKTGKPCFLAFYVTSANGNMFPVVAIAPDENTIRSTFPQAENPTDSELPKMKQYNRFAVDLKDLIGKWKGGDLTSVNYYNVYSGAYAGGGAIAMSDRFEFFANSDYISKHQGASGMVGSMSTYSQEYKGTATVNNWDITLPNRWKGETSKFHIWFEAVQGGRVLHLQDVQYSGSKYDLVRE
jgi:hypothetical protein